MFDSVIYLDAYFIVQRETRSVLETRLKNVVWVKIFDAYLGLSLHEGMSALFSDKPTDGFV